MWGDSARVISEWSRRDKQCSTATVHSLNTNQINYVSSTHRRGCHASLLCFERHEIGFISRCQHILYGRSPAEFSYKVGYLICIMPGRFDEVYQRIRPGYNHRFAEQLITGAIVRNLHSSWFCLIFPLTKTKLSERAFPPVPQVAREQLLRKSVIGKKCFHLSFWSTSPTGPTAAPSILVFPSSPSLCLRTGDAMKAVAVSYVTSKARLPCNRALRIHYSKLLFLSL